MASIDKIIDQNSLHNHIVHYYHIYYHYHKYQEEMLGNQRHRYLRFQEVDTINLHTYIQYSLQDFLTLLVHTHHWYMSENNLPNKHRNFPMSHRLHFSTSEDRNLGDMCYNLLTRLYYTPYFHNMFHKIMTLHRTQYYNIVMERIVQKKYMVSFAQILFKKPSTILHIPIEKKNAIDICVS